jgi:glutathione S-transferase
VKAILYVGPASHPSWSARLMLDFKRIPYKQTDLIYVISKAVLRLRRFQGVTVPALKLDGRRIQGSRAISRELDRIKPEPPLFPADSARRTAVEEAERFGDEDLQHPIRQITWWALRHDRGPLRGYMEGSRVGLPLGIAARAAGPIVALSARFNEANDENVRRDLAALPGMLQRIDDWIAKGVLGGDQLNAADFQIAPSLRLAMTLDDLLPAFETRPAGDFAMRVVPAFPGHMPPVLPPAWLAPLREATPAA